MKTILFAIVATLAMAGCGNHEDREVAQARMADAQAGNTQIYVVPRLSNGLDCGLAVNTDLSRMSLSCEHAPK